jgi:hypothetical protein
MRLNVKWFRLSSALIVVAALLAGCAKDELVKPASDLTLDERGLTAGVPNAPLIGLTPTNELVHLMAGPPVVEGAMVPITGLRDGENVIAIDKSPSSGDLFGVTNQNVLYRIDKTTGLATAVSGLTFDPIITGDFVGMDVNPQDNLIRVITNTGQILKISPVTGGVTGVESVLGLGNATRINSVAYMPVVGTTARPALYEIDQSTNALYRQTTFGSLQLVGTTGFTFEGEGGFEITSSYYAFAAQYGYSRTGGSISFEDITQPANRLFKIDLRTGKASSLGKTRPLIGLTSN